jgi:hypothetical protein
VRDVLFLGDWRAMMTETEQVLVDSILEFSTKLRLNRGLDRDGFGRAMTALEACRERWAGSGHIDREIVSVLVEVTPALLALSGAYKGEDSQQIQEVAYKLHEAIVSAVTWELPEGA